MIKRRKVLEDGVVSDVIGGQIRAQWPGASGRQSFEDDLGNLMEFDQTSELVGNDPLAAEGFAFEPTEETRGNVDSWLSRGESGGRRRH